MKKREAMVDIETLSSHPDAAVIAIGLCLFNKDSIIDTSEILIDPRLAPGHRDPDTLEWWNSQDPKVFKKMMSGAIAPWIACEIFRERIQDWQPRVLWANPPSFDIVILRHLFYLYRIDFPVHFTKERDFRTVRKFADNLGVDYSEPYETRSAHDAVDDAVIQAKALQIMVRDLALI